MIQEPFAILDAKNLTWENFSNQTVSPALGLGFHQRDHLSAPLDDNLKQNLTTALLGKELSGKTWLLFNSLRKLSCPLVIAQANFSEVSLASSKKWPKDSLLVMDNFADIVTYAKINDRLTPLHKLLASMLKAHCCLLACSSGPDFQTSFNLGWLTKEVKDQLLTNSLRIGELHPTEYKLLAQHPALKAAPGSISRQRPIGEIMWQLDKFKKRLPRPNEAKDRQLNLQGLTSGYLSEFLRATYYAGFISSRQGNYFLIPKDLISQLLAKTKLPAPDLAKLNANPFEKFFASQVAEVDPQLQKEALWQSAINFLNPQSDKEPWIRVKDEKIAVKSVVMFILAAKLQLDPGANQQLALIKFCKDQKLSSAEKKYLDINWLRWLSLKKSLDVSAALELLQATKELNLTPNKALHQIIFDRLKTVGEATEWIKQHSDQLDMAGCWPDLINKVKTFADLTELLAQAKAEKLTPDLSPAIKLLRKFNLFADKLELLKLLHDNKLKLQTTELEHVLLAAENYPELQQLLNFARLAKIAIPDKWLKLAIPTIERWRDIKELLEIYFPAQNLAELKLSAASISRLIKNSPVFEEANELFTRAQSGQIKISPRAASCLLKLATSKDEVETVKARLKESKLAIDSLGYANLILKAKSDNEIRAIYQQVSEKGLNSDTFFYQCLFRKASASLAVSYYYKMLNRGINPNYSLLKTLLRNSKTSKHALRWLAEMLAWGMSPSEDLRHHLARVCSKSPAKEELKELLALFESQLSKIAPPLLSMPAVFICHTEKQTSIRDQLVAQFKQLNIESFFAQKNPLYKDSPAKFYLRVKKLKSIVIIITADYWENPLAMLELVNLINDHRLQQICWLAPSEVELVSNEHLAAITNYWQEQHRFFSAKDSADENTTALKDKNTLSKLKPLVLEFAPKLAAIQKILKTRPVISLTSEDALAKLAAKIKSSHQKNKKLTQSPQKRRFHRP